MDVPILDIENAPENSKPWLEATAECSWRSGQACCCRDLDRCWRSFRLGCTGGLTTLRVIP